MTMDLPQVGQDLPLVRTDADQLQTWTQKWQVQLEELTPDADRLQTEVLVYGRQQVTLRHRPAWPRAVIAGMFVLCLGHAPKMAAVSGSWW